MLFSQTPSQQQQHECPFLFSLACTGADPTDVAVEVLQNTAKGKADFVVAATLSAKAAIWLRFLAPSFLNKMLVKRYEKSVKADS